MTTSDAPKTMTVPYDGSALLKSRKQMAAYLEAALEDGDPRVVSAALGNIARAQGMSQIAKDTGLSRESLYTALSEEGNPRLTTFLKVVHTLGIDLKAQARASK